LANRHWRQQGGRRILCPIVGVILLTGTALWTTGQASATLNKSTATFTVPSASMEPTIQPGDTVTVNRLAYRHRSVRRGDIIVFASPPTENCGGPFASDLIKRVIGLPGDTISLANGSKGYVLIDGKRLEETWLPSSVKGKTFPGPSGTKYNLSKPYGVPSGHYFVMGDNRTDSCDSRYWGPVAKVLIVGKVELPAH
jgi:signal peptidase I